MKKKRKLPKILSLDEEQRLFDWTRQNRSLRDYVVILTILRTGLRINELRELRVSDIRADKEILTHIKAQMKISHDRKGQEIPIPKDLREQLKSYLEWKQQHSESTEPMSFLFASAKSPQITQRHLQRIVRESTIGALGKPYRSHDLRRTFEGRRLKEPIRKDTETTFSDLAKQELKSRYDTDSTPRETEIIPIKKGVWRTYDAIDGLPGACFCLLQDRQGYLWLGTLAGLCRYDGMEFITYTTADGLADNRVLALCEDSQGRLWIGTGDWFGDSTEGGGVSCFDGKQFTTYTTADGLAGNRVDAICEDRQRILWFGGDGGISCFDGEQFTTYTTADGLASARVRDLHEDGQGRLWIVTVEGISCFDEGRFTTYITAAGTADARGKAICEDSRGRLWFAVHNSGVYCYDGQQFTAYTNEDGLVDNFVVSVCEDHQGRLWFGTWNGVSCFDGSRFISYTRKEGAGLWADGVIGVMADREKQLWFIHGELAGLSCFDADSVQLFTDGVSSWAAAQDRDGRIWYSSYRELYGIRPDFESSEVQQRRLPFNTSRTMTDSSDRLWIGTYQEGLYCYESSDAAWEAAGEKEPSTPCHLSVSDNNVYPLLEAKDGTIWFGFPHLSRLSRFEPKQFPESEPLESIETNSSFYRLIQDSRGRLWMGWWHGGGLSCWDGKKLTTYTQEHGLPSNSISFLVEDDAKRIWIGTSHGLCYFDGKRFNTCGAEPGFRNLYHSCAVKDASGQLWFATRGGGVYRTDGAHFQRLTEADGLPSNYAMNLLPQSDGSMIILTTRGIVRYQSTATVPPEVEIREVVADKVYRNPEELELTTTGADLLTISYHGLNLATRQMRYSYILKGYDEEWRETWERQARYENLPVGEYTFKVIAINRDLVPSEEPATLKLTVVPDQRDVRITTLEAEVGHLRRELGGKYHFENIVGNSSAIKEVRVSMERAIDSGLNVVVLITGDTGTGKELVAKAIHFNSSRKDHPLLICNCAAIPKELVASELFGHRKGAFTGAIEDKVGFFEAAEGGTLILDEIGDMPLEAQSSLLRVLQERKFQRVGEYTSRDVDVRVIAITNRDLNQEVEEGRFREDLYHRLNEFPIHLPPLRGRLEDIPLLAEHFLQQYLQETKRALDGFAPGVFEVLQSYHWPGNVRVLRSVIQFAADYAVQEGRRTIHLHHLPPEIGQSEPLIQEAIKAIEKKPSRYRELVDRFERRCLEHALIACNGNRTQAAKMLGLERRSLYEKMHRLKIDIPANTSNQSTNQ